MKTITKIRFIIPVMVIAAFMLVLKSCKKTDIDAPANNINNAEAARAAAIKAIKEKYGNVSAGIVYNVNKDSKELFYRGVAGNMVKIDKSNSNNLICGYNCNNTNNPANLDLIYTLSYVQRNYICESGDKSDINVSWTISVPFTPLATYGGNSSSGTLKVTDPGSTLHTYSNLPITIRTIGPDPSCAVYNTLYEISYKAIQVPDSYFGSGMLMDASLSLYNNCALVGNLITTGDVAAVDQHLVPHQPCSRVDKVWINPPGGGSSNATATGNYNICSYPSGFTPIDNHQLEYRLVNNGSGSLQWDDQTSSVHWGEPVGTSTETTTLNPNTGVSNLVLMTASSGTWLVRYRNIKNSTCDAIFSSGANPSPGPATANGNWGMAFVWFTEVWVL